MSAEQGDVETIREALDVPPEGHHRRCNSRLNPVGPESQCDCYMREYTPALAALDRLAAALERAEREQQPFKSVSEWRSRAEQAELTLAFQHEATAEIEARAEKAERALGEMREALRPFVENWDFHAADYLSELIDGVEMRILNAATVDDIIKAQTVARAALRSEKASDES